MGLLDKPTVLVAMLSGKYAVETKAGKLVGIYDNKTEAFNAALDDHRGKLSITDPVAPAEVAKFKERCLTVLKDDPRAQTVAQAMGWIEPADPASN